MQEQRKRVIKQKLSHRKCQRKCQERKSTRQTDRESVAQVLRETVDRHTPSPCPGQVKEAGDNGQVTLIISTSHVKRHARPADPATDTDVPSSQVSDKAQAASRSGDG
ncbi:hypothetical protein E2C01_102784 [Portunus trituberculatus]|uniref:Uncharacterized protein n=1 Tax=Portunus trituberculatus TaxID=210409 RepID=A0A5B7KJB2_PORTR|nr:hypothetical protein [Portunus trituberculatus]